MPRRGRAVFPGRPHHIVQRGRRKRDVFNDDDDRRDFIDRMAAASKAAGLHVWAYVLMRNHVHLVALPDDAASIAQAIDPCLAGYADAFDVRHGPTGPLWHPRFYASPVGTRYLWDVVRYVERNPVRAGMVERAEDYRWSSAGFHCGRRARDPLISPSTPLQGALADWSAWLREPDVDGRLANLRRKRIRQDDAAVENVGAFDHALDRRIFRGGGTTGGRDGP